VQQKAQQNSSERVLLLWRGTHNIENEEDHQSLVSVRPVKMTVGYN